MVEDSTTERIRVELAERKQKLSSVCAFCYLCITANGKTLNLVRKEIYVE